MSPHFMGLSGKQKYLMNLLSDFYINSTYKVSSFWKNIYWSGEMQSWYNAFCLLMFSCQFYEKWVSVRERNIRLLLETVTYIATTETVTCIITIEIVMCILHCRKYYLHDWRLATETHMHIFNKNCHPHSCLRNFHLHNCNKNIIA